MQALGWVLKPNPQTEAAYELWVKRGIGSLVLRPDQKMTVERCADLQELFAVLHALGIQSMAAGLPAATLRAAADALKAGAQGLRLRAEECRAFNMTEAADQWQAVAREQGALAASLAKLADQQESLAAANR